MAQFVLLLRKALLQALKHDALNTAKAAAYSGMLMLFPALMVLTTLLALLPVGSNLVNEIRASFELFLPADAMSLLRDSLGTHRVHSAQLIFSAASVSVFAGLGMILSLMEGFRRAYHLPRADWRFWRQCLRALLLVPIVLVPLASATLLLVFGDQIEAWTIDYTNQDFRPIVLVGWRIVRWSISLTGAVAVLGALYHYGTRRTEHWGWVAPGAITATLLWFPSTLIFGWYVSRIANYSMYYGSFADGIATLVWLYMSSFSALLGAELNGVLYRERQAKLSANEQADCSGISDPFLPVS